MYFHFTIENRFSAKSGVAFRSLFNDLKNLSLLET